ncbi:hypothetical protein ASG43_19485 [Aureimonas sp. Leaf454]|uniref:hypothetical protein n=1 Tax=Aureimonas sp. Leaf454 TaxID=1736381 RepID=UPI0006FEC8D7|nr:hypothetical protein [Aureimonas sp. Leaf454]KQT53160.1 hypothetical protein ASG43_19485 [Aureimonas sp. Leaf454]
MRQPQKPFVVERKRRTRSVTETPSIWDGATGRELHTLLQTSIAEDSEGETQAPQAPRARTAAGQGREPARDGAKGRILEARILPSEPEAPEAAASDAEDLERTGFAEAPRRRGRPRKHPVAPPADLAPAPIRDIPSPVDEEAFEADAALDSEPVADADADAGEVPDRPEVQAKATRVRPTFLERRREARKKLPPGKRWKEKLKF